MKHIRNIKHQHGTPNPVILTEEQTMISSVDRALAASGNAQTIGRSGELPLVEFLARHLPNTLLARSGHFVTPEGVQSPQIDIMILDSRYPFLAQNTDGSVLAMLHSVIRCIEVKTNITSRDIPGILKNSLAIHGIARPLFEDSFKEVILNIFAYRCVNRLATISDNYFELFRDDESYANFYLLRVPEQDQQVSSGNGMLFHLEPDVQGTDDVQDWVPLGIPMHTPLSDFYYSIVQDSYYSLYHRDFGFGDIGEQVMEYMSWSTIS